MKNSKVAAKKSAKSAKKQPKGIKKPEKPEACILTKSIEKEVGISGFLHQVTVKGGGKVKTIDVFRDILKKGYLEIGSLDLKKLESVVDKKVNEGAYEYFKNMFSSDTKPKVEYMISLSGDGVKVVFYTKNQNNPIRIVSYGATSVPEMTVEAGSKVIIISGPRSEPQEKVA